LITTNRTTSVKRRRMTSINARITIMRVRRSTRMESIYEGDQTIKRYSRSVWLPHPLGIIIYLISSSRGIYITKTMEIQI
jgi:hypothetical protein